jgi:glycosyltransferase involved in cell wall biosynthesis
MRVVMLLHKSVEHDARVRREASALQGAGHEVIVVDLPRSQGNAPGEGYEVRSVRAGALLERTPGSVRRPLSAARMAQVARRERPDAVHAHDAAMLVPGWIVARRSGARLVYDSHELATGVPYRSRGWSAVVRTIERLIVPRCDAVVTVSDGIAVRLQAAYALAERPTVVRNFPDLAPGGEASGEGEDLREALGVGSNPLVLHNGAVAADRGCENLVRSISLLDGAHLLFLGAEGPYADGLRTLAASLGLASRVHFHPPVPVRDLLSYSGEADVGVTLLEDTCENHRLALPNKAFEYVAAEVPVVASDLPELGSIVEEHGIGWTVDPADPASIAAGLRAALAARRDPGLHQRLVEAADRLSWANERGRLLDLYARLGS